jgi:hypothetical protein
MAGEALAQRTLLIGGLEPRDLDGVARRQLALVKRLLNRWDKLGQFQSLILCGHGKHVLNSRPQVSVERTSSLTTTYPNQAELRRIAPGQQALWHTRVVRGV